MRYIKLFENKEPAYNIGDYVKIKLIPEYAKMTRFQFSESDELFTKISEIKKSEFDKKETVYKFEFPDGKYVYGYIYLIRRRMTKKEIAEYKVKEEAKIYNL